jgi:hypothetical protein
VETETVGSIWSVDEFNKIPPLHTPVSDREWRDEGIEYARCSLRVSRKPFCSLPLSMVALMKMSWGGLEGWTSGGIAAKGREKVETLPLYIFAFAGPRSGDKFRPK